MFQSTLHLTPLTSCILTCFLIHKKNQREMVRGIIRDRLLTWVSTRKLSSRAKGNYKQYKKIDLTGPLSHHFKWEYLRMLPRFLRWKPLSRLKFIITLLWMMNKARIKARRKMNIQTKRMKIKTVIIIL